MQVFQAGTSVRYRESGRVYHAIVTAVTNQTTLNLRIGNGATKRTITGATKVNPTGATTGFYQGR